MDAPFMQIGGVNKDSMEASADAIVKVATCSPIPEVAVAALETLQRLGEASHVTIQNCTFTGNPSGAGIGILGSDARLTGDDD